MKLSKLKPNPKNPRRITDEKLSMLKKSMAEFGDLSGIVYNRRTGQLVGGHQRVKVLPPEASIHIDREFSEPSPTGTIAKGTVEIDGEGFVYREVDWSEEKEKAANIAANKHGGEWDLPQLSEWLLELDAANYDMDLTGFDMTELENLMAPVRKVEGQCDEDEVPENITPKTVRGDLYLLGNHRLLCGDSTNITAVETLMGGEKASLWSSDPPYGINHVEVANEKGQAKGYNKIANDELQDEALKEFIYTAITTSLPFMNDGFAFYMWHAMKMQAYFSQAAAAAAGILFHRQIIWVKPQFVFGRGHYHWRHELCLMGWLKGNEPEFYGPKNQDTVWNIGRENDKIHPTQKPVEIFAIPIRNHLRNNHIVYEPFAGSGSNFIAAEKEGVRCFGMELDPHYCDVIVARWEKYTGKQAKLLDQNRDNTAMEAA